MNRRHLLLASGGLLAAPTLALGQSEAETRARLARLKPAGFPREPIEFTVVYPAGGGMDMNARLLARFFEKWTGERVVVNNRTGGAGLVGHTWLATQAANDGHVVGVIANLIFADAMLRAQGRWQHTDLEPLGFLNSEGLTLVTTNDGALRGQGLREVLEGARTRPGTLRAMNVPNSIYEYMLEQLETSANTRFLKVPFQGGAPGLTALVGNNVDLGIGFFSEIRGHLQANRITPIGVTSAERSPFVNAPTVNEVLGRNDFIWTATRWVAAPRGVPADRRAWLAAAMHAATTDPEMQQEIRGMGAVPDPALDTPEKIASHLARLAELEREFFTRTGRLRG